MLEVEENTVLNPSPAKSGGVVSILWTGGWDSTYRVVELSRIVIEMFILCDNHREDCFQGEIKI